MKVGISVNNFFNDFVQYYPDLKVVTEETVPEFDLIIFPGGADVSPSMYGQRNVSSYTEPQRDKIENTIYKLARKSGKKLLGICRGCQFLNVVEGGILYQDILAEATGYHPPRHELIYHNMHWTMKYFKDVLVPSTHHQAVRVSNLRMFAYYKGVPELMESWDEKVLTLQFHPEFTTEDWATKFFVEGIPNWVK